MTIDATFLATAVAAFVAGLVRGFAGFGSALIYVPVASAFLGPTAAAPIFLVVDFVLTLPMTVRVAGDCRWQTVGPTVTAALLTAPLGAYVLTFGDPIAVRWGITALAILLLALLASGWRYHSEPGVPASVAVGTIAGFLGGFGQVSGPPVIVFWLSGPHPPAVIRANLFVFFAVVSLSSFAAYWWRGLFTPDVLRWILVTAPTYAIALFVGALIFRRRGDAAYRPIAYAIIVFAAVTSMPLFDGLLR